MGLKVRDSNIELLRVLASIGVILLHYNGVVAFNHVIPGTVNEYILQGAEALFISAVNLFLLISGYFSCTSNRRKAVKVFELFLQVSVLATAWYLISSLALYNTPVTALGIVKALIPNSYFVTIYLAVYILSPYINRAVEKLNREKFRALLVICFILFSLLPTVLDLLAEYGHFFPGLYPVSMGASDYGYTFVQFAFMYLIGAYLRRFGSETSGKRWVWLGVFLLSFAAVFFWQFLTPRVARSYCNPLVILLVVSVFSLFRTVSIRSRVINLLAKGAFTCFLVHALFLDYIGIPRFVNGDPLLLLGHMLLSSLGIFLICWVIWFVYDFVTRPIVKVVGKILAPLDKRMSLEDEEKTS
ncbi:MAG: acyltransferase [Clostridia bacterium]|nr:acyltransferase [Clostridia bacterium]